MPRSWSDDDLKQAVKSSTNMAGVCRRLSIKPGGNYPTLYKYIDKLSISIAHFTKSVPEGDFKIQPLSSILQENSTYQNTGCLKRRLLESRILDYRCQVCEISSWKNRHLTLQLDHVSGDRTDNRLENLRLLCPNCDSQQETYKGRKRKKR